MSISKASLTLLKNSKVFEQTRIPIPARVMERLGQLAMVIPNTSRKVIKFPRRNAAGYFCELNTGRLHNRRSGGGLVNSRRRLRGSSNLCDYQ